MRLTTDPSYAQQSSLAIQPLSVLDRRARRERVLRTSPREKKLDCKKENLQLHPDQPVLGLPAALSPPLSRRLAGEGHSRCHAFWPSLRKRPGCLIPAGRC